MNKIDNFKIFDNQYGYGAKAQYYLTEAELDALNVDRRIVRDVKFVAGRSGLIGSKSFVEMRVVPTKSANKSKISGNGNSIRKVSLSIGTSHDVVARLLRPTANMNNFTKSAVNGVSKVSNEVEQLVNLLIDITEQYISTTHGR